MEITFDKPYLSDLYYKGGTKDKKHRFQPQVIRKYTRVIDIMRAASRIEDLFSFNSLNYEMLQGDKKGIESVRINNQYRIEFKSTPVANDTVVTICNILELSNHYK